MAIPKVSAKISRFAMLDAWAKTDLGSEESRITRQIYFEFSYIVGRDWGRRFNV